MEVTLEVKERIENGLQAASRHAVRGGRGNCYSTFASFLYGWLSEMCSGFNQETLKAMEAVQETEYHEVG